MCVSHHCCYFYDRGLLFSFIVGSRPGYLDTFKKSSPTIRSNNCQLFLTADSVVVPSVVLPAPVIDQLRFYSINASSQGLKMMNLHMPLITYGCAESIE